LLRQSAYVAVDLLAPRTPQLYRFTVIANASEDSDATVERSIAPGGLEPVIRPLNLSYPSGIFSLSHVAIPFPIDDPVYGIQPDPHTKSEYGYNLGTMVGRGERGALIVDQDFLTRLQSNPFFSYLLERVDAAISRPSGPAGHHIATSPSADSPIRIEAVSSTFVPDDEEIQPFPGP
jgi:hypothetical protein